MELNDGSTYQEDDDQLFPLDFHVHRKNTSSIVDHSSLVAVDSGYGSTYNVTPFNTPNVSSNLSLLISPKQTINNSNHIIIPETSDATKLTPVTQNIKKITEFHITTPKSHDFPLAGTKRNSVAALNFEDYQSTPKKSKTNFELRTDNSAGQNIEQSLRFSRKVRTQRKTYRQKLVSASDFEAGLNENFDAENISCSQTSNFSPISLKTNREKRTPLSSTNANLQSSTPKSCGCKLKVSSIGFTTKAPPVKKLSFCDHQYDNFTDQTKTEFCTSISQNDQQELERSNKQKEQSSSKLLKTTSTSDCNVVDIYQEDSFRGYNKLYPIINTVLKDKDISKEREIGSNIRSKIKLPVLDSPNESVLSKITDFKYYLNNVPTCSNMEVSPLHSPNLNDFNHLEWSYDFEKNYNLKTKSDLSLNWSLETEDSDKTTAPKTRTFVGNSGNDEIDHVPRTPKKQKLYSLDQERLDILYPTIPCTPSKTPYTIQTSLKRKIDIEKRLEQKNRKFYDCITNLNIISKLETYTLVLDKIFELLSSQDLLNCIRVSKNWKRILRSNSKANTRLKKYLQERKLSKENNGKCKFSSENILLKTDGLNNYKKNERSIRIPFNQSNKNDRKRSLEVQQSPPVSPSKRKFHENQKVVRTLADNEKLTKCPRCGKSSRIINKNSMSNINGDNTSSTTNSYREAFQTTKSTFYNIDNNNISDISASQPTCNTSQSKRKLIKSLSVDSGLLSAQTLQHRRLSLPYRSFGICSGVGCKFQFCLECLCEHHPGTECKLSEPISPSKEDLQNGILQMNSISASRSLKSRRKSLKRLCF